MLNICNDDDATTPADKADATRPISARTIIGSVKCVGFAAMCSSINTVNVVQFLMGVVLLV